MAIFRQRNHVYARSRLRPTEDDKPIGTAVTERGARRVYWQWEVANFPAGRRWHPTVMAQDASGGWFLSEGTRA